jgi:hypothetical protein
MKDNDSLILENLYLKNVSSFGRSVINEISQRFVDEVKDAVEDKELPFNNIFGDKLRMIIPLMDDSKDYHNIIGQISKIKNFHSFDPEKKEVIKKIEVDPKYGGGVKFQKINLGRAISSLNIPEEEKKKMLDWFANQSSNINEMDKLGKYKVIISRSPIDLLRMSDNRILHSCHAEGGQFFHCAIAEAKNGGAIAFLVNTDGLSGITEDELQNEEIFEDLSRGVRGITPFSRIRIRRYESTAEANFSVAIPDTKIYGRNIENFYDTVKNFLKQKQFSGEMNVDEIHNRYMNRALVRKGGSYQDHGVGDAHIFNNMFDTQIFRGNLEYDDKETEGQGAADQFEEELRDFQNAVDLENFNASYAMDNDFDGNEPYYSAWGNLTIPTDELGELSDEFFSIGDSLNDHYAFEQLKKYDPTSPHEWKKRLPYDFNKKENLARRLSKFIRDFTYDDPTRFSDDMWSGIYFGINNDDIYLNCCFGDDCGGTSFNTDDYREFLRNLERYDDSYEDIVNAFKKALMKNGFIKNFETANIVEDEDLESNLKNFDTDLSDSNLYISKPLGVVPTPDKNKYDERKANEYLNRKYLIFMKNYLDTVYKTKPKDSPNQMTFKGFLESVQNKKYGIRCEVLLSMQDTPSYNLKEGTSYANFTLNIYYNESVLTKELYDLLIFLDQSMEDLFNAARYIVYSEIFGLKDQNTENLKRVYSKYFL